MSPNIKPDNRNCVSHFLWLLRQQVDINSIYDCDYKNNFGIDKREAQLFFKNYVAYLEELAEESNLWEEVCIGIQEEVRDGLLKGCSSIDIDNARIKFYKDLMYKRFDNEDTMRDFFNDEGYEYLTFSVSEMN